MSVCSGAKFEGEVILAPTHTVLCMSHICLIFTFIIDFIVSESILLCDRMAHLVVDNPENAVFDDEALTTPHVHYGPQYVSREEVRR